MPASKPPEPADDHHLSPDKLRTAKRLYEQKEMTVAQIGEVLGVSRSTVYRALSQGSRASSQKPQSSF